MTKLNHVAIAVSDPSTLKKLFTLLGADLGSFEDIAEQGVRAHFLELAHSAPHIELLEAQDPEGVIARFLKKRGVGIHHLAFETPHGELDKLCEQLQSNGYKLVYESPRLGALNTRVNFVHPESAGGVLIEILEPCGSHAIPADKSR